MLSIRGSASPSSYTYSARISVPKGLTVANGGRLERVEEQEHAVVYHYGSVLPSNRMDFAIAQYLQSTIAPFSAFYFPEHKDAIGQILQAARSAVGLLSRWFGPLESGRTMTLIEVPDGWGSQSDITTIVQSAGAFADPARRFELYHEISHLWDPPSTDQPSPRWNEGLVGKLLPTAPRLNNKMPQKTEADPQ